MPSDGPEGLRQAEWAGDPSFEAVACVRHRLQQSLRVWGLSEDVVEDAVLVVGELVANVVAHARTQFRLSVILREPLLRVSVSDRQVGVPDARLVNPTAGRITGLRLVTSVAFRWGWQEHETGKTVWAELVGLISPRGLSVSLR